jgi:16S rRNA (guanine1516-N2)-methyltransferase
MGLEHASVAVSADDPACFAAADALARELGLPRCASPCADFAHVLHYNAGVRPVRLELCATVRDAAGPVYVEFTAGTLGFRLRHGSRGKEPLARAVGLKGATMPTVLDATAGLGRDAFILAALGCRVRMIERSPLIAALLRDGLQRAAADPTTRDAAERLCLQVGDAVAAMAALAEDARPDVVYLDPMYPHRGKSALVKKEMRRLRAVVGEDADAPQLLATALRTAGRRVVVKRPRLAPSLPGAVPSHTLTGSTTRFDLYLPAGAARAV